MSYRYKPFRLTLIHNTTAVLLLRFIESEEFKLKVLVAIITLLVKGEGELFLRLAESKKEYTFSETIKQSSHFIGEKNGSGGKIEWNPNIALETSKGIVISPTTILNHEMDHAVKYDEDPKKYYDERKDPNFKDKQYDDKEEKRVITGSEQRTAAAMGEIKPGQVTRKNHDALHAIRVLWPNSTKGKKEPFTKVLPEVIITLKKKKNKK